MWMRLCRQSLDSYKIVVATSNPIKKLTTNARIVDTLDLVLAHGGNRPRELYQRILPLFHVVHDLSSHASQSHATSGSLVTVLPVGRCELCTIHAQLSSTTPTVTSNTTPIVQLSIRSSPMITPVPETTGNCFSSPSPGEHHFHLYHTSLDAVSIQVLRP